jgi:hypothetical protein
MGHPIGIVLATKAACTIAPVKPAAETARGFRAVDT